MAAKNLRAMAAEWCNGHVGRINWGRVLIKARASASLPWGCVYRPGRLQ